MFAKYSKSEKIATILGISVWILAPLIALWTFL